MIRTLLATTALATLIATGAYAQESTAPATTPAPSTENAAPTAPAIKADGSLATNIIGETVYNGTGDNAENIGKVSDVVFDKDGNAKSVVIGVGGFLGIGEKKVAFDYGKLQWAEKNGDRWLVAQTTKDELTAQPAFDEKPYEPAPAPQAANDGTATAPAGNTTDTTMAPSGTAAPSDTTMAPSNDTAQNAPADSGTAAPVAQADGHLASNILGEKVYNGNGDDAQNIGDVNDIVIAKDGKAQSLVIGVGGFLGLGQKNVTFNYDKVKWSEKPGDRWLVVEATKEELQALPDFDRKAYDPAPAGGTAADANTPAAVAPAAETAANAPAENTAPATTDTAQNAPAAATAPDKTQTGAIDKSTLTEMPMTGDISAKDLVGTTVYGANDANVGEIGDIVLAPDKKVDAVIVDVGGFLGIGEKKVAVGMDNLKFMTDKDGNKYLYTTFTKEQLEAQTAYDKGSYAQQRDKQRMSVQ